MRFGIGQLVTHAMGWAGAFCYYEVAAFQPLGISLVDMYINFFCFEPSNSYSIFQCVQ